MSEFTDHPVDIQRRYLELVWGKYDLDLAARIYHPDIVDHMPMPGQPTGREGTIWVRQQIRAAVPDLSVTVHEIRDLGGGKVFDHWTMSGTHEGPMMGLAASGRHVEFSGMDIARYENGRMVEMWHVEQLLQLLLQAGLEVSQ